MQTSIEWEVPSQMLKEGPHACMVPIILCITGWGSRVDKRQGLLLTIALSLAQVFYGLISILHSQQSLGILLPLGEAYLADQFF